MAKTFYHNITKTVINESDTIEVIDFYSDGDILYKSEAGNALIEIVTEDEINHLKLMHQKFNDDK